MTRQLVQIPAEQVDKLKELEESRPDLKDLTISKKVHTLLRERLAELLSKKASNPSRGKWYEYVRELFPAHVISLIAIGVVNQTEEMIGKPFTKILISSDGDKAWWCNLNEDVYGVGEYLLEKLRDKKYAKFHYDKIHLLHQKVGGICKNFRESDLKKLSKTELREQYDFLFKKLQQYMGISWDIDGLDIVLEEKTKEEFKDIFIKKYGKFIPREFNADYNTIATPAENSLVSVEHLETSHLALLIKDNPRLRTLFGKNPQLIEKRLQKHYPYVYKKFKELEEKYWWTSLGWLDRTEKTMQTFIEEVQRMLPQDIEKEIARIKEFVQDAREKRATLDEKYGFSQDLHYYLDVTDKYTLYHDWRKEIQMKGTAVMNYFLFEISRRSGIKYDDLVWCFPFEIQEFMRTGYIDLDKIRRRKEAYFMLVTKDGIEELTGEEAIRRRKEELYADLSGIKDFKGLIASVGKVSGPAKVCYSAMEANRKMKPGDILVASMTLPNYIQAIRKASAIVTDEGGVTCHAAIVSRELGIPCIIATKIATKIINDGDIVEVNANHGAVRILERK